MIDLKWFFVTNIDLKKKMTKIDINVLSKEVNTHLYH